MTEDTFGARLKAALKAKGWNQSDLVRESGLDKNTVSALVRDAARAQPATVGRIEQALGVTLDSPVGDGEDGRRTDGVLLVDATEAELLAELTYRIESLKRVSWSEPVRPLGEVMAELRDSAGVVDFPVTLAARRGQSEGKRRKDAQDQEEPS